MLSRAVNAELDTAAISTDEHANDAGRRIRDLPAIVFRGATSRRRTATADRGEGPLLPVISAAIHNRRTGDS